MRTAFICSATLKLAQRMKVLNGGARDTMAFLCETSVAPGVMIPSLCFALIDLSCLPTHNHCSGYLRRDCSAEAFGTAGGGSDYRQRARVDSFVQDGKNVSAR